METLMKAFKKKMKDLPNCMRHLETHGQSLPSDQNEELITTLKINAIAPLRSDWRK